MTFRPTWRRVAINKGQKSMLCMLFFFAFLWHCYNLQKLDRWITQSRQQLPQWTTAVEHNRLDQTTTQKESPTAAPPPQPLFFANPDNLPAMLAMGPHFLTTTSGCRMAKWVYTTATQKKRFRDCHLHAHKDKVLPHNMTRTALNSQLQHYDTIYVTLQKLTLFVTNLLPLVETEVVILTGQIYKTPPLDADVVQNLLEHPHVLHWFCQNLNLHYQYQRHNTRHLDHKVSPFPYGLKQTVHKHHSRDDDALTVYQQVFWERRHATNAIRNGGIYAGPLHPWPHRVAKHIPGAMARHNDTTTTMQLSPLDFYHQMAQHSFVLSPNGDRPECYRHYEALGLGVIPITELDREYYFHLQDGPIVYETVDWDLGSLQQRLQNVLPFRSGALQNMVLEEYWMEYVEQRIGRPLHWGRVLHR